MSREELQVAAAAHQLDFAPGVSDKSLEWQVSQNEKKNCSMTELP
jgi:hypothetical protein